jgi:hypothetical protein
LAPVEGLRVKAAPVAQFSPMLPKTIAWALTAILQLAEMSSRRGLKETGSSPCVRVGSA